MWEPREVDFTKNPEGTAHKHRCREPCDAIAVSWGSSLLVASTSSERRHKGRMAG